MVASISNKAIARQLGISHRTVVPHRLRIICKSGVQTVAELAVIAPASELFSKPPFCDAVNTPETR